MIEPQTPLSTLTYPPAADHNTPPITAAMQRIHELGTTICATSFSLFPLALIVIPSMKEPMPIEACESLLQDLYLYVETWLENTPTPWIHHWTQWKNLLQNNTPKALFSTDPSIRKQQYLSFASKLDLPLRYLIENGQGAYFFETILPELLENCATAWQEHIDQLEQYTHTTPALSCFSLVQLALRDLRRTIALYKISPLLATKAGLDPANVHTQAATKQLLNSPLHLQYVEPSPEEREPLTHILVFEAHTTSIQRLFWSNYTTNAQKQAIQQTIDAMPLYRKKQVIQPILDQYQKGLLQNSAPLLDPLEHLEPLYATLEKAIEEDDYPSHIDLILRSKQNFLEHGLSLSLLFPIEAMQTAAFLRNSSLKRFARIHHPELDKALSQFPAPTLLPLIKQALPQFLQQRPEEEENIQAHISLLEKALSQESTQIYIQNSKQRIFDILQNKKERMFTYNVQLLGKMILDPHVETITPLGISILGIAARIFTSATSDPICKTLVSCLAQTPIILPKEALSTLLHKNPSFYARLPHFLKQIAQEQGILCSTTI